VIIRHGRDGRRFRRVSSRVIVLGAIALGAIALAAGTANASTGGQATYYGRSTSFAFVSPHIAGAPTGSVAMTGTGSYDVSAATLRARGLFRCTDSVGQGPLSGCMTGQGVRWSSTTFNATQKFVCATDAPKTVPSDGHTVAFKAGFFRAGDGATPSFTANVIVADHDIAPDVPGVQNTWIQGVGCGSALQFFVN